jgi:flagellar motor switch protein FliG
MPEPKPKSGFESVLDMFRVMDPAHREQLLTAVSARDAKLAQAISDNIFRFEDLLTLEPAGIQQLLREVPKSVLALALRGMPEDFQHKLLQNVSRSAAEEVQEEWRNLGPRRLPDVIEARKKIIDWGRKAGVIPQKPR